MRVSGVLAGRFTFDTVGWILRYDSRMNRYVPVGGHDGDVVVALRDAGSRLRPTQEPRSARRSTCPFGIFAALAVIGACLLSGAAGAFRPGVSTGLRGSAATSPEVQDNVGHEAWSPDGRTVAFARILRRRTLLMVVDVASGRTKTLATLPATLPPQRFLNTPSFSPDGRRIGIVVASRLYVVDTRGRLVLDGLSDVSSFTFSPTGRQVAITTEGAFWSDTGDPPSRVVVVDLRSQRSRQLTRHGASPLWAPGGNWISFVRGVPDLGLRCELFVVRPSGGVQRRLTSAILGRFGCTAYGWSPDATRFALELYSGHLEIYAFRRDGRLGRLLSRSPPGQELCCSRWLRSGRFARIPERLIRVLERHDRDRGVMSPDGRRVVFHSGWACQNVRLWVGTVATGRVRRLTRGC
jgi:hypothetical protein